MSRWTPITAEVTSTLSLSELIDYHLEHNPDHVFSFFPAANPDDQPERVSFLEFGRATQRFARKVCMGGDAPVKRGEIVGIVANVDSLMYMTALGGLVRAGLTAFPISQRNSVAAVCHMLRKVGAHRLLITRSNTGELADAVHAELTSSGYELSLEELPPLDEIFPLLGRETAADPFQSIQLPAREVYVNDTLIIIHSSGSTGFPKPIPWTIEFIKCITWHDFVQDVQGSGLDLGTYMSFDLVRDNLAYSEADVAAVAVPPFHAMGIWFQLFQPLMLGQPASVFRPAHPDPPVVSSPETTLAALRAVRATATLVVPTFLEVWVHEPMAVKYLASLEYIGTGGGPLAPEVGDALVRAGCTIRMHYGGTEFGSATRYLRNPTRPGLAREDWLWFEFAPHARPRWVPQADDGSGAAELDLLSNERHVLAVENLPDVPGYATQDLFLPHPTKPGLWKIIGRADDVIVLANGEKVVPGPAEGTVLAHAAVRGAVLFGRQRNQIGILVEPVEQRAFDPSDETALAAFRNEIWATVEEANRTQPAFAKIFKEMILVTRPDAELPRVGKGSVSRKAALALYDAEISALYHTVEHPDKGAGVPPPDTWTEPEVTRWLLVVAQSVRDGIELNAARDLFAQGYDSLSATFLRNHILVALRTSTDPALSVGAGAIGNGFVYAHPTVERMAAELVKLAGPESQRVAVADRREDDVLAVIEKYSQSMPRIDKTGIATRPDAQVVLLTGSTGGLGSNLLAALLADDRVAKIYALNRPAATSSTSRHEGVFRDRGLDVALLASPKLFLVEADAAQERLGLPTETYIEIRNSVTIIIHNAWRLDFNLGLASFEPNIKATRHLLDLALTSVHASSARMLFTSSIGVTRSWPPENGPYPEEPQADVRWCIGGGYSESKWAAERLLVAAGERGLHTTSFRIGQIAGSRATGSWATTDWVPIMLKSSVALGCLPDAEGYASWMPADDVSQAIVDVALAEKKPVPALNLRHPHPTAWSTLMRGFAQALLATGVTSTSLSLVNIKTWVDKVETASHGANQTSLREIPAIKLLDIFAGMAVAEGALQASSTARGPVEAGGLTVLSTEKAQAASASFRNMPHLGEQDISRWILYWKAQGLFDDVASPGA